jgi:hypothetical protein
MQGRRRGRRDFSLPKSRPFLADLTILRGYEGMLLNLAASPYVYDTAPCNTVWRTPMDLDEIGLRENFGTLQFWHSLDSLRRLNYRYPEWPAPGNAVLYLISRPEVTRVRENVSSRWRPRRQGSHDDRGDDGGANAGLGICTANSDANQASASCRHLIM